MKTQAYLLVGAGVVGLVALAIAMRSSSKLAGAVVQGAGVALQAVNPVNPDNVFATGANAVTAAATGTPNSFGTWLAEVLDPTTRAANNWARDNLAGTGRAARVTTTPADRDDSELGAMMRSLMGVVPSIDLGGYEETVNRDDQDLARFARLSEFAAPSGPNIARQSLQLWRTQSEFE